MPNTISRGALWSVVALCAFAVTFDGYDLVVYGTTVPSLLADWHIGPAQAGTIGSYALIGMLIGALLVGTVTDLIGRRRILVLCMVWFSACTALCAIAPNAEVFGLLRFVAGIGLGGLMPTAAALVVEYAPAGKHNLTYALMQSGYAVGGILASALAIPVIPALGWKVMYLIGAVPVLAVPIALRWLPESLEYLVLRGRVDDAAALASRLGVEVPVISVPEKRSWLAGLRELAAPGFRVGTILLWLASFSSLLMVYGMNTWLPQIMRQADFPLGSALSFLLVFNLGSVIGSVIGGRAADILGSKPVVAVSFLLAVLGIALLATRPSTVVIYVLSGIAGYGTIGTTNLLNVFVTRYYPPTSRATGIGWSLGVGRLGAILGPVLGGLVLASGASYVWNFYLFAAVAIIGLAATGLVPVARREPVAVQLREQTS
ncbi:MFS transporter [Kutzneria kofuensis]|uniref:AAHS family benzoate transporter-like MFS transporter n=1 Tax=Kutzneria kofuensis TaxID=103725 RepID=A0A7W9KNN4_9PSEU|nr:aromatic acid/H+ symport family MFS transporter [Kutzneria kofuensis]MBB5895886.1 AAHS family benzoate transporter-like MFS transporter [Kutzneria kofuensis]